MTSPATPSRDPLLDSLIAHLTTGAQALTAALNDAVAIRDRLSTLAAHADARQADAERRAAEARTNPPTLMRKPRTTPEPSEHPAPLPQEPAA